MQLRDQKEGMFPKSHGRSGSCCGIKNSEVRNDGWAMKARVAGWPKVPPTFSPQAGLQIHYGWKAGFFDAIAYSL